MTKQAFFFIDDTIWVIRDIARQKPKSIFDNEFLKVMKTAHDNWGLTVQLNLFYRTDFFYGSDEFTLCDMPDTYKDEFQANADWLKFAFHAKQEFPDYPYINATYDDVKKDYEMVAKEVKRFAGDNVLTDVVVPHWFPVSKAGCQALADCGVRLVGVTRGKRTDFDGDASVLPYGHAARLLQNRQPEAMLYTRESPDKAITSSLCSHNHLEEDLYVQCLCTENAVHDEASGLDFTAISGGPCLNLYSKQDIADKIDELKDKEFIGICVHEQYFYSDYYAYQPDFDEKVYTMAKKFKEHGFTCVTADKIKRNIVK